MDAPVTNRLSLNVAKSSNNKCWTVAFNDLPRNFTIWRIKRSAADMYTKPQEKYQMQSYVWPTNRVRFRAERNSRAAYGIWHTAVWRALCWLPNRARARMQHFVLRVSLYLIGYYECHWNTDKHKCFTCTKLFLLKISGPWTFICHGFARLPWKVCL